MKHSVREKSMLKQTVVSAFTLLLLGCGSVETRTHASESASELAIVSLCDVTKNPDMYLEKVIKVRANYSVVKHYDSFFSGADCLAKFSIAEGSRKDSDRSVKEFFQAGDSVCKERNIESLCTLKADVVVVVRLRKDTDGEIVADPIHVDSFTYLP